MSKRRKNPLDEKLPSRVYPNGYSYIWKPTSKESIKVCSMKESIATVWRKYEELVHQREHAMTFKRLWEKFLAGGYYSELSPRTQNDYLDHGKKLLSVFGNVIADSIKPEHVRIYMDKRGLKSKTQANHEKSSMSRVYRWGYERGYVKGNPCVGVSKFSIKSRDQYMDDNVYCVIYKHADTVTRAAMEISYLCAARQADVLKLRYTQLSNKGIFIQQGKTGTKQIKMWSTRLLAAIESVKDECPKRALDGLVMYNRDGGAFTRRTFNARWVKAVRAAEAELGRELDFTFHDIKAKGISDYDGSSRDKQLFSGHKTESQVLVYDRKVKISPTLGSEFPKNIPGEYSK